MQCKTLLLALAGLLTVVSAQPLPDAPEDKTLSPYFMVKSDDPKIDALPLLSTSAAVDIAGVIADVRVTQVYKNSGHKPLEAIYVFPASTRAAVYAMKMTIGDRTITAKIEERQKARQDYEQALSDGKSASLLEQQRPNVFQMNVGNIMPGDTIKVELSYTELLVPTDGTYEFAYPTVVGPRYTNKAEEGAAESDKWVQNPYQHSGDRPLYDWDLRVNLMAGMPIQDITCSSHKTGITWNGQSSALVRLDESEKKGGNRDFILKYRLAGGQVQSGLLLYQGATENFFLAMVQPPQRVTAAQIPPREYIFIVDVSGSMYGFPLDISKQLLRDLIGALRPTDYFNVMLFSGGNTVMAEHSLAATKKNVDKAANIIDNLQGSGGTELLPALKRALALPRAKGTSRTVVIATDGYVDVEQQTFDMIRDNLGDANFFAFGIGSGVNRYIIEGMARVGMGEPFVIESEAKAPAVAEKFRKYIQTPVLTDVAVEFAGLAAYDVEPKTFPDVLAERPVIVFGKFRGSPAGKVVVTGHSPRGDFRQELALADYPARAANSGLRYLWARHRIQLLSDYAGVSGETDDLKQQVTDLGLQYGLLTQYTSFVAIDSRVRNKSGDREVVKQPLPLPEGVSDYAVGGAVTGRAGMGYGGGMGKHYARKAAPMASGEQSLDLCLEEPDEPEIVIAPTVRLEYLTVVSGPDETSMATVEKTAGDLVGQNLADLVAAYKAELAKSPALTGGIKVRFTVGPNGAVTNVTVQANQLNKTLAAAVERFLKRLRFTVPVSASFDFVASFGFGR